MQQIYCKHTLCRLFETPFEAWVCHLESSHEILEMACGGVCCRFILLDIAQCSHLEFREQLSLSKMDYV